MQWFVFPVEGGLELVVDSTDEQVLQEALAEVAVAYPNHLISTEWVLESGDVLSLVPAREDTVPRQHHRSAAEQKSRAAHPAGKGRAAQHRSDTNRSGTNRTA